VEGGLIVKPGKLDLPIIWRGCVWQPILLEWFDQNGDPLDVSGYTPKASLRDGTNLNATFLTDGRDGKTTLGMTTAQTASLALGVQDWDWIWTVTSPYSVLPPFLSGKVPIQQPKTRP
jgi:hypothetical protein